MMLLLDRIKLTYFFKFIIVQLILSKFHDNFMLDFNIFFVYNNLFS